ncbi:MAG: hypothetical protein SU899_03145 [Chloroflexota bacterium]|nr:hypothetical protein [Chloroflexota bacterium]
MAFKKRWLFVILAAILALSLLPACAVDKSAPAEPPMATPMPHSIPPIPPIPVNEISVGEAEQIVGVPLMPKYLPPGYEFRRGFMIGDGPPPHADLILYFSDEEITGEVKTAQDFASLTHDKIILNVGQVTKMPSPDFPDIRANQAEKWGCKAIDASEVQGHLPANTVSVVDINEVKAYLSVGETSYGLQWCWPGLIFYMSMLKELTVEEIMKIAESMK